MDVLAVLAELDGEALEWAGVQAGQEALDDELGAQVKTGDLADDLGLEILFRVAHVASATSSLPSAA